MQGNPLIGHMNTAHHGYTVTAKDITNKGGRA